MKKNNIKVYINRKEIGLYQSEKIKKDVIFFQKIIPYVRISVLGSLISGMLIYFYNLNLSDKKPNYAKMLFLKIIDLEENKSLKSN